MSRWHSSSCLTPSVATIDGALQCKSCGYSLNIDEAISKQGAASPWKVPVDGKFGELNLSWPPSIPYRSRSHNAFNNAETQGKSHNSGADTGKQQQDMNVSNPVYEKTLSTGEFRLLCLPATVDNYELVHGNLETYAIHDCPEYETVSYCWGGEDADTKRIRPIFLGDYWDVVLQTNNGWSMLKYLRPWRGFRLLWVDGVCINQQDYLERETQVAQMGSIYRHCLRVIIYLGENVVRAQDAEAKNKLYPTRYPLEELDTKIPSSVLTLKKLLNMRYFQRVWVVQEVIEAPAVLLPVNGLEFVAGPLTAERLRMKSFTWESSAAPWMQQMCSGSREQQGNVKSSSYLPVSALKQMLQQSRYSEATDPRDKIFGLVGFLPDAQRLKPDYSLCSLHILIGTVAYLLFGNARIDILTHARGDRGPLTIPSWLPDWEISNLGEGLLKLSDSHIWSEHWPMFHKQFEKDRKDIQKNLSSAGNSWYILLPFNHVLDSNYISQTLMSVWAESKRLSIDPKTASLTIPLIYINTVANRPVPVYVYESGTVFQRVFSIMVADRELLIFTSDIALDSWVKPGHKLFLLANPRHKTPFLLFLNRISSSSEYRLTKSCPCFGIFMGDPTGPTRALRAARIESPFHQFSDDPGEDMVYKCFLRDTVYDVISVSRLRLGKLLSQSRAILSKTWMQDKFERVPPTNQRITNLIKQVFATMVDPKGASFSEAYILLLEECCIEYTLKKGADEVETLFLHIKPADWIAIHRALDCISNDDTKIPDLSSSQLFLSDCPWKRQPMTNDAQTMATWTTLKMVRMSVDLQELRSWLETVSQYFEIFSDLAMCGPLVEDGDILALCNGKLKREYRSLCFWNWPKSFLYTDEVPGKMQDITII